VEHAENDSIGAGPLTDPELGARLAGELGGDLACIRCAYPLRGLSIRVECPECGLPVLTTILSVVDPHAEELQPIEHPRLIAGGLIACAAGALVASVLTWVLRVSDLSGVLGLGWWRPPWAAPGAAVALAVSGLGALALVRPHARTPVHESSLAAVGVVLYAPLVWVYWRINLVVDARSPGLAVELDSPSPERFMLRVVFMVIAALVLVTLRPSARSLASRSLVVRTGRVDRQPMLAIALVLLIGASADALMLLCFGVPGTTREVLLAADALIVAATSVLVTVGLVGLLQDAMRLAPVLATPTPSPRQVLGAAHAGGSSSEPEHG